MRQIDKPPSGGIFSSSESEENRVSVMRNIPRKIKGISMTDIENIEIKTFKVDKCFSLSGRSTLTFEMGLDTDKRLHLRVTHNSGKGHHNPDWVAYEAIEPLLMAVETLSASGLATLFQGTSVNTAGFVLAVLKHLGAVQPVPERRNAYQYVNTAEWTAARDALTMGVPCADREVQAVVTPRNVKDEKGRGKRAASIPST